MQPSGWPQPPQPPNPPPQLSQPQQGFPNLAFPLGMLPTAPATNTQFNLANMGLVLPPGAAMNLPWAPAAPEGQALYPTNFLPGTSFSLPGTQLPNLAGTQLPNLAGTQLPNLAGTQLANLAGTQLPNFVVPPPAPTPQEPVPSVNRTAIHNQEQEQDLLSKLYDYIKELGVELEPGYTVEVKKRVSGNCAGTMDVYYYNPAGKRFRSKQEVAKALGLSAPAPSSAGGKSSKGGGSSSSRVPRDQAAAAAREEAAALGAQLPLLLECGVTVEDLGRLHSTQPGHHTRTALYPESYTASREAPMGEHADPATSTRVGTFMSSVLHGGGGAPVFAVHLVPPGRRREDKVELATAADPNAVWQKVWDEQQTALLAVRATAAAAKVQEEQGVQQQRQSCEPSEQPWSTPAPSQGVEQQQPGGGGASVGIIPASTTQAVAAAVAQLPLAQQWLVKVMPMEEPPWGLEQFGFTDAKLLQLLEALEGVEECVEYQYIGTRPGGWDAEMRAIGRAAEKHSKDAGKAISKAGLAMERGVNKVQAFALKHSKRMVAASKKGQPPAALTAVEEQQLHGPLLVAAQATGLMPGGMHASPLKQQQQEGEPMGFLASIIAQGRVGGEEVRVRDSIARILDKMITKIEIQERRDKERAEMQVVKGGAPVTAAPAHQPSGSPSVAPAPGTADAAQRPTPAAPPPPPPEPLQHALARGILADVLRRGGGGSVGGEAGAGAGAGAAEVVGQEGREGSGHGPGEPGPGGEEEKVAAAARHLAKMVLGLKNEDMDRLLQVWDFVAHMPNLVGLDSPPSLVDLLAAVLLPPAPPFAEGLGPTAGPLGGSNASKAPGLDYKPSAADLGEQLHVGLVRLLVGEAYEATSTYLMSITTLPMNKRDTGMGAPRVTAATWPEAARRYMAAAATAAYLSMAPGRPPSLVTQPLAGALSCLGVHDWLAYLSAGINAVPSSLQAVEDAGRAEVAARGGLRSASASPYTAAPDAAAGPSEHKLVLQQGQSAMNVDESGAAAAAAGRAEADGVGGPPTTAVPGLLAAAAAAGLPAGALAGLAADEGVVAGPCLSSGVSSGGVRGPGALVSRVALLPAPQHGSRTAAEALLNLEDGRAMAAAERLLQHHRLTTRTFTPLPSAAADATQLPGTAHGAAAAAAAAAAGAAAAPSSVEASNLPESAGAAGPAQPTAASAADAAQPVAPAAAAGTKIKFKLKGKLGGSGGAAAAAPAAALTAHAAPATQGAPKVELHNNDPAYEASGSAEERALAEQHDVRCGRVLLDALMNVTAKKGGTGQQMAFCAHELRSLLKAPRGLDLHAVSARLDAGLYQATGSTARAMAADIVACCALWRTTSLKMAHHGADKAEKMLPFGFERGGTDLADEVERKLAELLPRFRQLAHESLQQEQQQQQQQAALIGDIIKAETLEGAQPAAAPGDAQGQQQQQQQQQQQAVVVAVKKEERAVKKEEGAIPTKPKDLKALRDCRRMYAPAGEGCRLCWRSEDPSKLILCDGCDDEYHCYCAFPPLEDVPEEQWYCPLCASQAGRPNAPDRHQQRQVALEQEGGFALPPLPPAPPAPQLLPAAPQDDPQALQLQGGQPEGKDQVQEQADAPHEEGEEGQREMVPPELRAGMAHLKRMLRLADALGLWAGEAPQRALPLVPPHRALPQQLLLEPPTVPEAAADGPAGVQPHAEVAALWGPSARIDLLHALVELCADSGTAHAAIDAVEEARKEAKRHAQALKSKARKFAADAAAAEAGTMQPPPPPGTRPARFKPQDKAALSQDEVALLTLLEEQGEKLSIRRQCLGVDRLGNKYWWVGDPGPPAVLPQEKTAAATLAARPTPFSGFVAVEQPLRDTNGQPTLSSQPGAPASSCPPTPGHEEEAEAVGAAAGADKDDAGVPVSWGAYTSAASLAPVTAFAEGPLRSALARARDAMARAEGPQGTSMAAPDAGALVASAAAAGAGVQPAPGAAVVHGGAAAAAEGWWGAQGSHAGTTPAASAPPSPSPMASPAPAGWITQQGAGAKPGNSRALAARPARGAQHCASSQLPSLLRCSSAVPARLPPPPAPAATHAPSPNAEAEPGARATHAAAEVLRQELLALFDALPAEAFRANNFWGSKERQALWREFATHCPPTPCHLSACLTLLEHMLADELLRPHWRWWSHPAQHPAAVTSFNTVWFRLAGLHGAFKQHPFGPALPARSALGAAAIAPGAPPTALAPRASAATPAAGMQAPAKGAAAQQPRGQKRSSAPDGVEGGRQAQRPRTGDVAQDWEHGYPDLEMQRAEQLRQQRQEQRRQQQLALEQQRLLEQQQWLEEVEDEEEEEEEDAGEEEDDDRKKKDEEEDYNPFADSSAGEQEEEEPEDTTRRRRSAALVGAPSGTRSRSGGRGSRGGAAAAKRPASKLPTTRRGRLELQQQRRALREQQQQQKLLQQQGVAPMPPPPAPPRPLRPPSARKRLRTYAARSPLASEDSESGGYGGGGGYSGSMGDSGDAELEDEDVDIPLPPAPTRSSTRGMRVPAPPPPAYVPAPPPGPSRGALRVPQPPVPMPPMPPPAPAPKKSKYSEDSFFDDL